MVESSSSAGQGSGSSLAAALHAWRNGLFGALSVMAKRSHPQSALTITGVTIKWLQIMAFLFMVPQFKWSSNALPIAVLTEIPSPGGWFLLMEKPYTSYYVLFYISLAWVIIFVGLMTWATRGFMKGEIPDLWPLRVLAGIGTFSATVAYVPLVTLLLSVFMCDERKAWWTSGGYTCYSGIHLALAVVAGILAALFIGLACLFALVFFDSHPLTSNLAGKAHGRVDFFMLVVKTALVFTVEIFPGALKSDWALVAINVAAGVLWAGAYFRYMPMTHHRMNQINLAFACTYVWSSLCLIIAEAVPAVDAVLLLYVGAPTAALAGVWLANLRRAQVSSMAVTKMSGVFEVEMQCRYQLQRVLEDIMAKDSSKGGYGHSGSGAGSYDTPASSHATTDSSGPTVTTTASSAPGTGTVGKTLSPKASFRGKQQVTGNMAELARIRKAKDDASKDKSDDGLLAAAYAAMDTEARAALVRSKLPAAALLDAEELLRSATLRFPTSGMLHVFQARFYSTFTAEKHLNTSHLLLANRLNPSLDVAFLSYQARRAAETGSGALNSAMHRVSFEKHLADARSCTLRAAQAQLAFWQELGDPKPDISVLHQMATDLADQTAAAEEHFKEVFHLHPQSLPAMRLFAQYNLCVANNPEKAAAISAEADRIEDQKNKEQNGSNHSSGPFLGFFEETAVETVSDAPATISVGASSRDLGIILSANAAACRLLGYTRLQLERRNVSILVPAPFSEAHDGYMRRYLSTGEGRILESARVLLAKHRQGHLLPVILLPRETQLPDGTSVFTANMRPLSFTDHLLLLDGDFTILGGTAGALLGLALEPATLSASDVSFIDYCSALADPSYVEGLVSRPSGDVLSVRLPGLSDSGAGASGSGTDFAGAAGGSMGGGIVGGSSSGVFARQSSSLSALHQQPLLSKSASALFNPHQAPVGPNDTMDVKAQLARLHIKGNTIQILTWRTMTLNEHTARRNSLVARQSAKEASMGASGGGRGMGVVMHMGSGTAAGAASPMVHAQQGAGGTPLHSSSMRGDLSLARKASQARGVSFAVSSAPPPMHAPPIAPSSKAGAPSGEGEDGEDGEEDEAVAAYRDSRGGSRTEGGLDSRTWATGSDDGEKAASPRSDNNTEGSRSVRSAGSGGGAYHPRAPTSPGMDGHGKLVEALGEGSCPFLSGEGPKAGGQGMSMPKGHPGMGGMGMGMGMDGDMESRHLNPIRRHSAGGVSQDGSQGLNHTNADARSEGRSSQGSGSKRSGVSKATLSKLRRTLADAKAASLLRTVPGLFSLYLAGWVLFGLNIILGVITDLLVDSSFGSYATNLAFASIAGDASKNQVRSFRLTALMRLDAQGWHPLDNATYAANCAELRALANALTESTAKMYSLVAGTPREMYFQEATLQHVNFEDAIALPPGRVTPLAMREMLLGDTYWPQSRSDGSVMVVRRQLTSLLQFSSDLAGHMMQISEVPHGQLSPDDERLLMILANGQPGAAAHMKMKDAIYQAYLATKDSQKTVEATVLWIFVAMGPALGSILLAVVVPILLYIDLTRDDIMERFLDLPNLVVTELRGQAERRMKALRSDGDDTDSEAEDDVDELRKAAGGDGGGGEDSDDQSMGDATDWDLLFQRAAIEQAREEKKKRQLLGKLAANATANATTAPGSSTGTMTKTASIHIAPTPNRMYPDRTFCSRGKRAPGGGYYRSVVNPDGSVVSFVRRDFRKKSTRAMFSMSGFLLPVLVMFIFYLALYLVTMDTVRGVMALSAYNALASLRAAYVRVGRALPTFLITMTGAQPELAFRHEWTTQEIVNMREVNSILAFGKKTVAVPWIDSGLAPSREYDNPEGSESSAVPGLPSDRMQELADATLGNSCEFLTHVVGSETVTEDACVHFAGGIFTAGLQAGMREFLQHVRNVRDRRWAAIVPANSTDGVGIIRMTSQDLWEQELAGATSSDNSTGITDLPIGGTYSRKGTGSGSTTGSGSSSSTDPPAPLVPGGPSAPVVTYEPYDLKEELESEEYTVLDEMGLHYLAPVTAKMAEWYGEAGLKLVVWYRTFLLVLVAAFLACFSLGILTLYLPAIGSLGKDIQSKRSMLLLLPIEVTAKVPSIRAVVIRIASEQEGAGGAAQPRAAAAGQGAEGSSDGQGLGQQDLAPDSPTHVVVSNGPGR